MKFSNDPNEIKIDNLIKEIEKLKNEIQKLNEQLEDDRMNYLTESIIHEMNEDL